MSAKSRSRRPIIQLPLKRDDFIDAMTTMEHEGETFVLIHTAHGRVFSMQRVARYKRPYKVHEIPACV